MKEKTIVLLVLITIASISSFFVLKSDGYFDEIKEKDAKVLATNPTILNQVALVQETTATKKPTVSKTPTTTTKKAPVKKKTTTKKKTVKKVKHKLNLAPPVITPATAPYSAKNRNN